MRDSGHAVCTCVKQRLNTQEERLASLAHKGTSAAAAKRRRCQEEDAQQRDSKHSLASNLQATIVVPSRLCHGNTVVGALS